MNQQLRQKIKLNGYRELVVNHCELVDLVVSLVERMDAQDARISQLEYLMTEEIMAGLVKPNECARSWRSWATGGGSSASPAKIRPQRRSRTLSGRWRGVARACGAFQRLFVHSPGYAHRMGRDSDGAAPDASGALRGLRRTDDDAHRP